jgi:hypothetical protein
MPTQTSGTDQRTDETRLLIALVAILLIAALLAVALILRKRQRRPPGKQPTPTKIPPSAGPLPGSEIRAVLTSVRPQVGAPYLESRNRSAGVLYCPLNKPTAKIGRDLNNDLIVDASFQDWETVSGLHAVVEYDGKRAVMVDQGSLNGVYVNNRRTGTNALQDGWTVSFGKVAFIFRANQGGRTS